MTDKEYGVEDAYSALMALQNGGTDAAEPDLDTSESIEPDEVEVAAQPEAEPSEQSNDDDDDELEIEFSNETKKIKRNELKELLNKREEVSKKASLIAEQENKARVESELGLMALHKALENSRKRLEPYANLDYIDLRAKLDDATYNNVKALHQEALAEHKFFTEELTATLSKRQEEQANQFRKASEEAVKILRDKNDPRYIPDFSEKLYNEMTSYVEKNGIPKTVFHSITDASALNLIHKAMLYDKSKKVAANAKPVSKQPTKLLKSGTVRNTSRDTKFSDAIKNLKNSKGSGLDAAAAAFDALN